MAAHPPTIVRIYRGGQQADANATFQADATELAKHGYAPTTQSWAQGQWGCGAFLVALLLCIVLIGLLVFIYMLVVKPEGTLTVTYEYQGLAGATKVCPRCAESIKKDAKVCRFCGYELPWTPTHRVPDEGMTAWVAPDPLRPTVGTLNGGIELVVTERAGDWARVEGSNGWTGWVDGRRLVQRSERPGSTPATVVAPMTPASEAAPTVESRLAELEQLRVAGLVTDSDAASQRTRILEDM